MSSVSLWIPTDALIAALRELPAELVAEGNAIVEKAAAGAVERMHADYPPGELTKKLSYRAPATPFGTTAVVKNGSSWAYAYEHGTAVRHTNLGYNRGAEPGKPVFGRDMAAARRGMHTDLAALLARHGLLVKET